MDECDVNVPDTASGWTPLLRCASMNGKKEVVDILIKFGANVNALDFENKSALMIAVISGNQPLVQILIEHGADIHVKNEYGKGIYEMAVSMERQVRKKIIKKF